MSSRGPPSKARYRPSRPSAAGKYPVSRPLFFYVKKAHVDVIPGIKEFVAEFTSEKAWGPEGYLADKGMIPMPDAERKQVAADVAQPEDPVTGRQQAGWRGAPACPPALGKMPTTIHPAQ